MMVVAEYAKVLLEGADWDPGRAKDALLDRSIKAVADGQAIKMVWRKSLDVAPEIERQAEDHEVQLRKEEYYRDLEQRDLSVRHPLDLREMTPEAARERYQDLILKRE